jgi:hypothetical protein
MDYRADHSCRWRLGLAALTKTLSGEIVVVASASLGLGKGIALAMAGAAFYVTGHTVADSCHPLPGTVGETFTYNITFETAKAAMDRSAHDMAVELKPHGVASISLWQGFTFTERAQEKLKTVPGIADELNSALGVAAEFPARVIAALAADPNILAKSGGIYIAPELATKHGLADTDGRTIPSLRNERGAPIWKPV